MEMYMSAESKKERNERELEMSPIVDEIVKREKGKTDSGWQGFSGGRNVVKARPITETRVEPH